MRRVGLAVPAALLALAGCSLGQDDTAEPVRPASVELVDADIPDELRLGVLVTLQGAPGAGAEWLPSAAGSQVAAYQYRMGGHDVVLEVADDKGTPQGAEAAVRSLLAKNVAGIVAVTEGDHLEDALTSAQAADTAVLLPYETDWDELPDNAWLTGPEAGQVATTLSATLRERGLARPFVVAGDDDLVEGVGAAATADAASDPDSVVRAVKRAQAGDARVDSVVLAAPARTTAQVVAALQGSGLDLPVILGPSALSPVFATSLDEARGSLAGELTSVGLDAADVTASSVDERGNRAATFFSALRIAANDPETRDLFGQQPFATQAAGADIRSHDAVVALVSAAAAAGSAEAADVLQALPDLTLDGSAGLAGPDLDFSEKVAVDGEDVVALQSTPQSPGLRPAASGSGAGLFWFAVPAPQAS